jgi:hypothetical protein
VDDVVQAPLGLHILVVVSGLKAPEGILRRRECTTAAVVWGGCLCVVCVLQPGGVQRDSTHAGLTCTCPGLCHIMSSENRYPVLPLAMFGRRAVFETRQFACQSGNRKLLLRMGLAHTDSYSKGWQKE